MSLRLAALLAPCTLVLACDSPGLPLRADDAGLEDARPFDAPPDTNNPQDAAPARDGGTSRCPFPSPPVAIGAPSWHVDGVVQFSAEVGTAAQGAAPVYALFDRMLQPNHGYDRSILQFVSRRAHEGPYDNELAAAVAALGLAPCTTRFSAADFAPPRGIITIVMLVADAGGPTGSSPESVSEPILPRALFPMQQSEALFADGVSVDPSDGMLPWPGEALAAPVEGLSHLPEFYATNTEFSGLRAPALAHYEWRVTLQDARGNGWRFVLPFSVE